MGFQPIASRPGFHQNGNAVGQGQRADHGFLYLGNESQLIPVQVHQQFIMNLEDKPGSGAFQQFVHMDHGYFNHIRRRALDGGVDGSTFRGGLNGLVGGIDFRNHPPSPQ